MFVQRNRLIALLAVGLVTLAGCSSNDDSDGGNGGVLQDSTGQESQQPVLQQSQARVVAVEDDNDGDGIVDTRYEWNYDAAGRVTTVIANGDGLLVGGETFSYTYDGDDLTMMVTPEGTALFTVENGRTVQIDDVDSSISRYRYDSAGRLIEIEFVGGPSDGEDDDCNAPIATGADPESEVLRIPVEYDSAGRFIRAEVRDEFLLIATYRPAGHIQSLKTKILCNGVDRFTTENAYNEAGLIVRSVFTIDDYLNESSNGLRLTLRSRTTEYIYENSIVVRSKSNSSFVVGPNNEPANIISTTDYYYRDDTLLSHSETTEELNGQTNKFVRTLKYEDKACVRQVYTDPFELMFHEVTNGSAQAELECGFFAEIHANM